MLEITGHDACVFILSFFGGGGLGMIAVKLFIKNEAKEALKEDLAALLKRLNHIENNYVLCKFCDMQHANLKTTLDGMDHKLDILIKNER